MLRGFFNHYLPDADTVMIRVLKPDASFGSCFVCRPADFQKNRAALVEMGYLPLHEKVGCGCCRGPETDRCCCQMHQDIPRDLRAHACSEHR